MREIAATFKTPLATRRRFPATSPASRRFRLKPAATEALNASDREAEGLRAEIDAFLSDNRGA
jgi:hypothetical protein